MEKMEAQTPPQPNLQATPTQPIKASSCSKVMLFTSLITRILTFIFLLIALIILATNSSSIPVTTDESLNVHFQDVLAYRYVFSVIVIGFVYTLVQIGFVLYQVIKGKRICKGKAMHIFDFYADKVLCGLLATGAGAGFGVTIDLKPWIPSLADYFDKGVAATSLLLIAYLFSEASQIVSSYALPKRDI